MSIRLNIKGTIVNIPSSAASPNWSEGIIDAIVALSEAVNSVTGTYDVAPQTQNIDANNSSSNVDVTALIFPSSEVRSATIFYSVYRMTEDSGPDDGQEVAEGGIITITYNAANATNNKWEIVQTKGGGSALVAFTCTDTGQIQFTTSPLTGVNHVGEISLRAISVLNAS